MWEARSPKTERRWAARNGEAFSVPRQEQEWSEFYGENKKLLVAKQYTDEVDARVLAYGIPEMLVDSVAFDLSSSINVLDGCFADTATVGYLVKGGNNIITNSGFYNNKLMGLRHTLAIKNESPRLVVTNSFFTNPTGTDRFYEGERENVIWSNNNADEKEVFGAYFAEKNN